MWTEKCAFSTKNRYAFMMIEVALKRLKSERCQFRKGTNLNVEGKKVKVIIASKS